MALLECFKPVEPKCKVNCGNCKRWNPEAVKCKDHDEMVRGKKDGMSNVQN